MKSDWPSGFSGDVWRCWWRNLLTKCFLRWCWWRNLSDLGPRSKNDLDLWYMYISMYSFTIYRKFPKYSDTQKVCCNHSKIWTMLLYHGVMNRNNADGMANSVDPDQTAPQQSITETSPYSFGNFLNYHYITIICPFNLLTRFKCYNTV